MCKNVLRMKKQLAWSKKSFTFCQRNEYIFCFLYEEDQFYFCVGVTIDSGKSSQFEIEIDDGVTKRNETKPINKLEKNENPGPLLGPGFDSCIHDLPPVSQNDVIIPFKRVTSLDNEGFVSNDTANKLNDYYNFEEN